MAMKASDLDKRVSALEARQTGGSRCSGWVLELDRTAFDSEVEFDEAIEAAIATHRETCDAPPHGFVLRPPPCASFDEWVARHKPR